MENEDIQPINVQPEVIERNDLQIDFVTKNTLKKYNPDQKSDLIIEKVKQGRILVFEGGLDPSDEAKLVEKTMLAIDHEKFMGVEICSPQTNANRLQLRKKNEQKITIVAPSNFEMSVRTL
jgi:hypothetical protein